VALGMLLVTLSVFAFVDSARAGCTYCGEWNRCAAEDPNMNCGGGYACDDGAACRLGGPCWCKPDVGGGDHCHCG
jgi:hypothetical protein